MQFNVVNSRHQRRKSKQNCYELLGISHDADEKVIREAYEIAMETFEKNSLASYSLFSDEESDEILRQITEAYMTLSDPISRSNYDRKLQKQQKSVKTSSPTLFLVESDTLDDKDKIESPLSIRQSHAPTTISNGDTRKYSSTRLRQRKLLNYKNRVSQEQADNFIASIACFNGEALQRVRQIKQIDLAEVAKDICVRLVYLEAIEDENFAVLPSASVYVKGFLQSYSRSLDLPPERVIQDYMQLFEKWHHHYSIS